LVTKKRIVLAQWRWKQESTKREDTSRGVKDVNGSETKLGVNVSEVECLLKDPPRSQKTGKSERIPGKKHPAVPEGDANKRKERLENHSHLGKPDVLEGAFTQGIDPRRLERGARRF